MTSELVVEDVSSTERIFRGMLGMGMVFAVVAAAVVATLVTGDLLFGPDKLNRDGIRAIVIAGLGAVGGGFVLGVCYAGILSVLARGRSFRELSILRVATAGAVVGLIPTTVISLGMWLGAGRVINALTPLAIFAPVSAAVATATLLIARRKA